MNTPVKALGYALIAAGACWIPSEVLEITAGGRTKLTLALTAVFHLLMVPGIWGAYAGELAKKTALSRAAAAITSVGFLLLVYPPIAVAQTPTLTISAFMSANPVFLLAGMLATLGTVLFGAIVLRHKSYPTWIGVVLMAIPLIFPVVMFANGPILIGIAANILESIALIAMGVHVVRALKTVPVASASRAA